jgi:hypothetical protein
VGIHGVLNREYPINSRELRRLRSHSRGISRVYDYGDLGAGNTTRASHALRGGGIQLAAVVLGNDQNFASHL